MASLFRVASVGVDTWGVDYGLLGKNDELLGNPYHYRDRRTDGVLAKLVEVELKNVSRLVTANNRFRESNFNFGIMIAACVGNMFDEIADASNRFVVY